ncbi:hypothetical protein HYT52_02665 [Candidatus Woesearchaeota archaeon]|nr:hypothetical protein [Candidatus Woesearchaeota archaeon]
MPGAEKLIMQVLMYDRNTTRPGIRIGNNVKALETAAGQGILNIKGISRSSGSDGVEDLLLADKLGYGGVIINGVSESSSDVLAAAMLGYEGRSEEPSNLIYLVGTGSPRPEELGSPATCISITPNGFFNESDARKIVEALKRVYRTE